MVMVGAADHDYMGLILADNVGRSIHVKSRFLLPFVRKNFDFQEASAFSCLEQTVLGAIPTKKRVVVYIYSYFVEPDCVLLQRTFTASLLFREWAAQMPKYNFFRARGFYLVPLSSDKCTLYSKYRRTRKIFGTALKLGKQNRVEEYEDRMPRLHLKAVLFNHLEVDAAATKLL
jgi:hypothetical protein